MNQSVSSTRRPCIIHATRLRLCLSDGGVEEEAQRGAGERDGESQTAEQRGVRFSDFQSPTAVSNLESVCFGVVEMISCRSILGTQKTQPAAMSAAQNPQHHWHQW